MGIASFVLGLIALFGDWFTGGTSGFICGLLAIIFGATARKKNDHVGLATAGLVMGIISIAFGIIAFILACGVFAALIGGEAAIIGAGAFAA